MSKLVVQRPSRFVDWVRNYDIEVDGQTVASIGNDETVETDIEPGRHTVQATIDWCSSPPVEIDVDEGEEAVVRVEVGRSTLKHLLLAVLFITIWRKQYLAMRSVR